MMTAGGGQHQCQKMKRVRIEISSSYQLDFVISHFIKVQNIFSVNNVDIVLHRHTKIKIYTFFQVTNKVVKK